MKKAPIIDKQKIQVPALIQAALYKYLAEVGRLLQVGMDPNGKDRDGRTALHQAAFDNHLGICQALLDRQADINARDLAGFAPLHFAAQEYALDVAKLLVARHAVVDIKNKYGNTPLFTAVFHSKGRGEIINLLLKAGSNPHATNDHGNSPLMLAQRIANYDIKQLFREKDVL